MTNNNLSQSEEGTPLLQGSVKSIIYNEKDSISLAEEEAIGVTSIPTSHKTSLFGAIFNLSNTAIGSGTVAIPYAFSTLGSHLSLVCMAFSAISTWMSLYFLIELQNHAQSNLLTDVGKKAFGRKGEFVVVVFLLLLLFAPLIAYQIIVGDYALSILRYLFPEVIHSWFFDYRIVTFVVVTFIIFPLSLLKDMTVLAKMSFVCLICVLYTVCLVIWDSSCNELKPPRNVKVEKYIFNYDGIGGMATILMSFISHTSVLDVMDSMKRPTMPRKLTSITVTNLLCCICYSLIGWFGYHQFGSSVSDNILTQKSNIFYIIGCATFGLMIALTYPLVLVPASYCLQWIMDELGSKNEKILNFWTSLGSWRHLVSAIILIYTSFGFNLLWKSIKTVFALFGCLCGSFIIFIFPSVFYLKCLKPPFILRVAAIVNILIGMMLLIFGTGSQIAQFIQGLFYTDKS